jgi:uncharacterized damage-inducible protein DinB
MTEKDMYLHAWDFEQKTTEKVLKAFPPEKADLKPAEKSRTAKELASVFVQEREVMIDGAIRGNVDFAKMPAAPKNFSEVCTRFESEYPSLVSKVKAMPEAEWEALMEFPVGPGQMGKFRRADILWMALHDQIHHRGQMSVYLRMAGGKVPSIYGPSGDEPWQ